MAVRAFEPVSDLQLLAAIDRAERHHRCAGVQRGRIAEHLDFARGPHTTRRLRPQIQALLASGLLVGGTRHGSAVWGLTSEGRRMLASTRRQGQDVALPEAPQHRTWRTAREQAVDHIEEIRRELTETLAEAQKRQEREDDATAWAELSLRLRRHSARLCWVLHCIHEWPEPGDDTADLEVSRRLRALHLTSTDVDSELL